jgi:hypothetical protein
MCGASGAAGSRPPRCRRSALETRAFGSCDVRWAVHRGRPLSTFGQGARRASTLLRCLVRLDTEWGPGLDTVWGPGPVLGPSTSLGELASANGAGMREDTTGAGCCGMWPGPLRIGHGRELLVSAEAGPEGQSAREPGTGAIQAWPRNASVSAEAAPERKIRPRTRGGQRSQPGVEDHGRNRSGRSGNGDRFAGCAHGHGVEELFGLGHRHVEAFMTARRWPHSIRGLPRPGQSGRRAG